MKNWKKNVIKYLIWLLVIVVVLEIAAPFVYNGREDRTFSKEEVQKELKKVAGERGRYQQGKKAFSGIHAIHPYLGYVKNKDVRPEANEHGFMSDKIIATESANTVNVAITGGSVALGLFESQREYFEKKLALSPRFKGKKVNFQSFALEGYKQPQQLFGLNYLLFLGAKYDIVLNLDGYNDLVLPFYENLNRGVYPYFPRGWDLYATKVLDPASNLLFAELNEMKANKVERAQFYQSSWLKSSRFCLVFWKLLDKQDEDEIRIKYKKFVEGKKKRRTFQDRGAKVEYKNGREAYMDIVDKWYNASAMMHQVCQSNGIEYYHILQPNQYVPKSKPFSKQELKIAVSKNPKDQEYIKGRLVEAVYPVMSRKGQELKAKLGVKFIDFSMLFAGEKETIYTDICCHINSKGNKIMVDELIKQINKK